ncbi:hypothetical protein PN4B1_06630 [Paenibacillus naphthalenovorans]|nr:hypothetical protein PN4B1_06630 [Paenibacillus naphthalenovorans]
MSILWGIILAIAACYLLFIFPTQWLKVEKVRHSLGLNIKILQISDMHIERLRIRPEQLRGSYNRSGRTICSLREIIQSWKRTFLY